MFSKTDTADDGYIDRDDLPLSFGAFKPVGHVAVVLPDDRAGEAFVAALAERRFPDSGVLLLKSAETAEKFKDMLPEASGASGFGSEIQSMRQIYLHALDGCSLVLVHAPDDDRAAQVEELVRRHGAKMATRYGRLLIEDLI